MPSQQEQGIGAFASKLDPQPLESEDDKWRERARAFRSWSGRFFGGALAEIYEHVEGHRNDSATIPDLALTSLTFDAGLLRNISTDHVDERTSTAVGAQGDRAGGWKRVDFSADDMTGFNSHDSFETCGFAGNHV